MHAIIIDDEQNNITNLQQLLQKHCPMVKVIATAMNADEGFNLIQRHHPDIVFLDIQMPGKNGFELLQSLPAYNFEVIFVTAYDQYGIQAIKFSAIDYLLKPISIEELQQAVDKAQKKLEQKKQNLQLQNLIDLLKHSHQKEEHRIALPSAKETRFIQTQYIVRCESNNNYTTFFLSNNEKIIVSRPIYEYEEILKDYGFIRTHQSHLVNKKYIRSWVKEDGGYLLLQDATQIPISKQKKELIKQELEKK
jgi:two-component system LytT family response regulator